MRVGSQDEFLGSGLYSWSVSANLCLIMHVAGDMVMLRQIAAEERG